MKFRIHYEVRGVEDSFIAEGDDVEEVRAASNKFFEQRGLDVETVNPWSEELS